MGIHDEEPGFSKGNLMETVEQNADRDSPH